MDVGERSQPELHARRRNSRALHLGNDAAWLRGAGLCRLSARGILTLRHPQDDVAVALARAARDEAIDRDAIGKVPLLGRLTLRGLAYPIVTDPNRSGRRRADESTFAVGRSGLRGYGHFRLS